MTRTNGDTPSVTDLEQREKATSACGASGRSRWTVGIAVVLVIVAVVASRVMPKDTAVAVASSAPESTLATPAGAGEAIPAGAVAESAADEPAAAVTQTNEALVGREINFFADLNELPRDIKAVFVFVPSREPGSAAAPRAPMEAAARTISAQGSKIALLTVSATSPEYEQFAMQVAVPGVLAMVKDGGTEVVSGEITETNLVQAFIAASGLGGTCCCGGAVSPGGK